MQKKFSNTDKLINLPMSWEEAQLISSKSWIVFKMEVL